jgi:hypothetical protein
VMDDNIKNNLWVIGSAAYSAVQNTIHKDAKRGLSVVLFLLIIKHVIVWSTV